MEEVFYFIFQKELDIYPEICYTIFVRKRAQYMTGGTNYVE